ncbi:hypothetical protein OG373_06545 [Streptomyces avidinii]|uniref:hypothetical protein n=1 Tax=Streptomyces avidinii TaxID=1895 RepID=UPI003865C9D8|nr:hypothetical protein OG373_06545 [Streptomyces avidinii]
MADVPEPEEIREEALAAQELKDTSSGTARYDNHDGCDRWCERRLKAIMHLAPAEQHNHSSPVAARWARAHDTWERAIKPDHARACSSSPNGARR